METPVLRNSSFKYQALTEPDSIRLILLQPASSAAAQIECSLLHTTLSLCDGEIIDHYTALSYVWGNTLEKRQISVDGYLMTITATLEAALRDLRDGSRVLRVWADALCIDQSNTAERNQQVRQMGRIYSTANHTVVHLGLLTPPVESILKAVRFGSSGVSGNSEMGVIADAAQIAESSLLNRPWFSRVWIFQELVLSRDPWVQCGGVRVRWIDLCDLLLSRAGKRGGLKLLTEIHFARERRGQTDLFNLLQSRRGLGATDARDMIFAHLGVASDRAALEGKVNVDYQRSCERLYEDVARYLIDTSGPENVFFHVDDINHSPHRQGLASWAPDWSIFPSPTIPMYKDNRMSVVSLKPKLHYVFIQERPVLGFIGYGVDVISNVSLGILSNAQHSSTIRSSYQRAVEGLQALYASVGGSYASGDENGQYTRIGLQGKEVEHEELCLAICSEWSRIVGEELSLSSPLATVEELESHRRFTTTFNTWLRERAKQGIIFVEGSEGMESIMYNHLRPNAPSGVLNGRKLAGMTSGRVGVVPSQALDGDMIVYLAGIPKSLVIRATNCADPEDLNQKVYKVFQEKCNEITESGSPYVTPFLQLLQRTNTCTEHAVLIGECYVEGAIGWSFKERYDYHDFKVFALH